MKRKKNEDFFLIDPEIGFMVVADGMGGHAAGEVASRLASTICTEQLRKSLDTGHVPVFRHVPSQPGLDPRSLILGDCVKFSNTAVYEAAKGDAGTQNMGTTLVAALQLESKITIANVGDSRAYLIRNGVMQQCTVDHSFVQEQVDRGVISKEDAEKSDLRNMLTRCIGNTDDVDVDLFEMDMEEGDYLLLCSDGLTKMLDDDQILAVFREIPEPEKIIDELIERANMAGGGDNITVIISRVEQSSSSWSALTDKLKNALGS